MGSIKGQKHNPYIEGKYAHVNPNDVVFTPDWLAKQICEMFPIAGTVLEPCKGEGAFLKYLPENTEWCEIADGVNYYDYNKHVNWLVTNPPYCFVSGEVLTKNGWKHFKDIKIGETVLSVSKDKLIEWNEVTDVIIQNFNGEVVECNKKNTSFAVTKNHTFLTDNGFKKIKDFNFEEYFPRFEFKWKPDAICNTIKIPYSEYEILHRNKKTRILKYYEKEIDLDCWLKFFGFWLADGCTTKHHYGISIKQKSDNCELIREILNGIGFKFNEYKNKGGTTNFTIYNMQLWNQMRQFGDSYSKFIPRYIKELPKEKIELFLKYYMLGDTTNVRKLKIISTVSKQLSEDLQECFLKCGTLLHFSFNPRSKLFSAVSNPTKPFKIRRKELMIKQHNGNIFCLTVKNNNSFLVRVNESVYFSGNSDYNRFLDHSFSLADNIVLLVPVAKMFKSMGTLKSVFTYGGFVSIHTLPASKAGFPFGFPCGVYYMKRGYKGDTKIEMLPITVKLEF